MLPITRAQLAGRWAKMWADGLTRARAAEERVSQLEELVATLSLEKADLEFRLEDLRQHRSKRDENS